MKVVLLAWLTATLAASPVAVMAKPAFVVVLPSRTSKSTTRLQVKGPLDDIYEVSDDDDDKLERLFSQARRDYFKSAAMASAAAAAFMVEADPQPVYASGGATAGGAYLQSAKQRYNTRVLAMIGNFVALKGDAAAAKDFFATDAVGSWKDGSTAGYLLANAFRRNSTASPDSLPAVQKWKAFAGQVAAFEKSLKKKDSEKITAAYNAAMDSLEAYLAQVELPPISEIP